jgi:hypothetical protein
LDKKEIAAKATQMPQVDFRGSKVALRRRNVKIDKVRKAK